MKILSGANVMWAEVEKIIARLVRGKDLNVARVNEALDVELVLALDSPQARRYQATILAGPLRDVELRLVPETGLTFLVLRANPDRPLVVRAEDLRGFGTPKWTAVEPNAGPEGQFAACYVLPGMEVRVGYRTLSRRLESVALQQKSPAPPSSVRATPGSPEKR
jgi:hypothetical protein